MPNQSILSGFFYCIGQSVQDASCHVLMIARVYTEQAIPLGRVGVDLVAQVFSLHAHLWM